MPTITSTSKPTPVLIGHPMPPSAATSETYYVEAPGGVAIGKNTGTVNIGPPKFILSDSQMREITTGMRKYSGEIIWVWMADGTRDSILFGERLAMALNEAGMKVVSGQVSSSPKRFGLIFYGNQGKPKHQEMAMAINAILFKTGAYNEPMVALPTKGPALVISVSPK